MRARTLLIQPITGQFGYRENNKEQGTFFAVPKNYGVLVSRSRAHLALMLPCTYAAAGRAITNLKTSFSKQKKVSLINKTPIAKD
jgi:hypothetical protein